MSFLGSKDPENFRNENPFREILRADAAAPGRRAPGQPSRGEGKHDDEEEREEEIEEETLPAEREDAPPRSGDATDPTPGEREMENETPGFGSGA